MGDMLFVGGDPAAGAAAREGGLFPEPGEMKFRCSCPDWTEMCKHVAAALYGVGNRLDHQPELLFLLRGVDAEFRGQLTNNAA